MSTQVLVIAGSHRLTKKQRTQVKLFAYDFYSGKNVFYTFTGCATGVDRIFANTALEFEQSVDIYFANSDDPNIDILKRKGAMCYYGGGTKGTPYKARLVKRRNLMLLDAYKVGKELNKRPLLYAIVNNLSRDTGTFKCMIEALRLDMQIVCIQLVNGEIPKIDANGIWEDFPLENSKVWVPNTLF